MATESISSAQGAHATEIRHRSRPTVVVRVGGVAAVLSGLLIVGQEIWDIVAGGISEGAGESALHSSWVLLMLFGVVGMYVLQQEAIGRFGEVATLVALLGIVTLFSATLPEATLLPALDQDSPLRDNPPPAMLVIIIGGFVVYLLGLLLFAIATFRAGVLPRRAAALLIAGIVLGIVAKPVIPGVLIVMGAAFVWLGVATLARRDPAASAGRALPEV